MSSKNSKTQVIARLTMHRADSTRTIVEIHEGATFASFYQIFMQRGNRRSTKAKVRVAGRREWQDLEALAKSWEARQSPNNPITDTDIIIYKARKYRRLISARPDELGLVQMPRVPLMQTFYLAGRS